MSITPSTLRQTLELDGPEPAPIRVAGFLRHYAGMIRRNERWDVPETMANAYESAALQLEKYHAEMPELRAIKEYFGMINAHNSDVPRIVEDRFDRLIQAHKAREEAFHEAMAALRSAIGIGKGV